MANPHADALPAGQRVQFEISAVEAQFLDGAFEREVILSVPFAFHVCDGAAAVLELPNGHPAILQARDFVGVEQEAEVSEGGVFVGVHVGETYHSRGRDAR